MRLTRYALAASVLALTACGGETEAPPEVEDDGRAASGEILPSSISDDMIETDRLRSQAPLAVDEPVAPSAGASTAAPPAAAPEEEAAPVEEPAPPPEPETFEEAFGE